MIQAVISWVSPYHPIRPFFDALCRPFLQPFERLIPLVGGVDSHRRWSCWSSCGSFLIAPDGLVGVGDR
ncbi:MAG: YggT family protein [Betaproteobacteria bacterium]|nr:YggT family protein [Betaproteobacteria bacterium]